MNMACTVGVAEVDQGRVDQNVLLALFQQVLEIAQVSEAAAYSIPCTVLIQDKDLPRSKPTLKKNTEVFQTSKSPIYSV
jgi:hypothetical protein